jgi:hypothetical protein
MNTDPEIDERLARLGRRMSPADGFEARVMRRIGQQSTGVGEAGVRRYWSPLSWSVAALLLLSIAWAVLARDRRPPAPAGPVRDDRLAKSFDPATERLEPTVTRWQTVSEQAVTLDGDVPAREVRQQDFERIRWVDPEHHATFEKVVPGQAATFIATESY